MSKSAFTFVAIEDTATVEIVWNTKTVHITFIMPTSAPTRPVSGTYFEALQLLRPHPRIRPVSASCGDTEPRLDTTALLEEGRRPRSFGTTMVYMTGTPHLYVSRTQYEVARNQVLGSLDRLHAGVLTSSTDMSSPARNQTPILPLPTDDRSAPGDEKVYGAFCRTRSVVRRSLRRSKVLPGHSLRSEYCSTSLEQLISRRDGEDAEGLQSIISSGPYQIPPLRPASKLLPKLTISIPVNETSSSVVAVQHSVEDGCCDIERDERDSLCVSPLRLRSSSVTLAPQNNKGVAKVSSTIKTNKSDNVFSLSDETYQTERPVTKFKVKLRDTIETGQRYKDSKTEPVADSSTSRLRHTAVYYPHSIDMTSLRSQYSASEPASTTPTLDVPKTYTPDGYKTVRVAPSLEAGLTAEGFRIYEVNAIAAAAPVVHGVKPDVVEVLGSQSVETCARQNLVVLDQQPHVIDVGLQLGSDGHSHCSPSRFVPATPRVGLEAPATVLTDVPKRLPTVALEYGTKVTIPTMPFEVLEMIAFYAAYGDTECQALTSSLYEEIMGADALDVEPRWGVREQHLLHQSQLVRDLDLLVQFESLRDDIFQMVRGQLFPTLTTELLRDGDLTKCVYQAVSASHLDESLAKQILKLVTGDEDFAQYSPEEEAHFERRSFNPEGFVYDESTDFGCYERLGSVNSTAVGFDFESMERRPQPQPQTGWRSSLLSKVIQVLRLRPWKRKV